MLDPIITKSGYNIRKTWPESRSPALELKCPALTCFSNYRFYRIFISGIHFHASRKESEISYQIKGTEKVYRNEEMFIFLLPYRKFPIKNQTDKKYFLWVGGDDFKEKYISLIMIDINVSKPLFLSIDKNVSIKND